MSDRTTAMTDYAGHTITRHEAERMEAGDPGEELQDRIDRAVDFINSQFGSDEGELRRVREILTGEDER